MSAEKLPECTLAICAASASHEAALSDWIPLAQTILWAALIGIGIYWLKDQIKALVGAFVHRISTGSSFKAGPVELGEDLKLLEKVLPSHTPSPPSADDWSKERDGIYQVNSGFFLVHVIRPSNEKGQLYDVSIFLVRHKSTEMGDVEFAEFFFGAYWKNKVFRETKKDGIIGISTAAYGPFLCTCHITLKNKNVIHLHRYIDFEMGRAYQQT
ncbi:MAG: hypothetical protein JWR07_745 [Nevskia sp.]|nr:hypothetical protein [Nevskia sp.]